MRLTKQQIEARIRMYEEAAEHLTMEVHEDEEEYRQSLIVIKQITALNKRFQNKYWDLVAKT